MANHKRKRRQCTVKAAWWDETMGFIRQELENWWRKFRWILKRVGIFMTGWVSWFQVIKEGEGRRHSGKTSRQKGRDRQCPAVSWVNVKPQRGMNAKQTNAGETCNYLFARLQKYFLLIYYISVLRTYCYPFQGVLLFCYFFCTLGSQSEGGGGMQLWQIVQHRV